MHVKNLYFQHAKNSPYFFKDLSFELEKGKIHVTSHKVAVKSSNSTQLPSENNSKMTNLPPLYEKLQIHALHGKNGMRKSVLLNLLCGKNSLESVLRAKQLECSKTILVNQRFDKMIVDQFTFEQNLQFASMSRFPNP